MQLDGLTLLAAGSFVTAVSGILLIAAWTQIRASALLVWAAGSFANACGIAILLVALTREWATGMAAADLLNVAATALVWLGARHFNGRRPLPWVAVVVIAAMLALRTVSAWYDPLLAAAPLFAANVAFLVAAGWEISRPSPEPLAARWPLAAFQFIHSGIFVLGLLDVADGTIGSTISGLANRFSLIHFETVVYSLGSTVFMVLLCKQRSERTHIEAARHDPLTGVVNRGAFLESAGRIVERHRQEAAPVALVMFDLDRFKSINDTYGHAVGDEAIRLFTQTAMQVLRPTDLLGRYGGEEFALILPGATAEIAYAVAERIRRGFADAAAVIEGERVAATISGGIAVSESATDSIELLLRRADHHLYRAKHLGRNRIAVAPPRRLVAAQVA